jgi:hypothetical protein
MFYFVLNGVARVHYAVRPWLPSNLIIDTVRTRRGHKWGLAVMLLAIPAWFAASVCVQLIERGGPGWLQLAVFILAVDGIKFAVTGPMSLVWLGRARWAERRTRRRPQREGMVEKRPAGFAAECFLE